MTEKATIESEMADLSRPVDKVLKGYKQTLPLLSDMHFIYHKADVPQKHLS